MHSYLDAACCCYSGTKAIGHPKRGRSPDPYKDNLQSWLVPIASLEVPLYHTPLFYHLQVQLMFFVDGLYSPNTLVWARCKGQRNAIPAWTLSIECYLLVISLVSLIMAERSGTRSKIPVLVLSKAQNNTHQRHSWFFERDLCLQKQCILHYTPFVQLLWCLSSTCWEEGRRLPTTTVRCWGMH